MYVHSDISLGVSIDSDIERVSLALESASKQGEWQTVKSLSDVLAILLREKRKRQTPEHRKNLGTAIARGNAQIAQDNGEPNADFLKALSMDPRFGSLRRYAEARGIPYSTLSAYAAGRLPASLKVDAVVRRDFPTLKWDWPAGLAIRARGRPRKKLLDT